MTNPESHLKQRIGELVWQAWLQEAEIANLQERLAHVPPSPVLAVPPAPKE